MTKVYVVHFTVDLGSHVECAFFSEEVANKKCNDLNDAYPFKLSQGFDGKPYLPYFVQELEVE
jgi:hypothetical protein